MSEIASAYVSLLPSFKGGASSINRQLDGPIRSSGSSLGKTFGKLFVLGAGVLAAAGIGNLLKGSIDEAREAQKVSAATTQIIKSTGGAAGITADQVGQMAGRLSSVTGIDDEVIQQASNLLLTFKNVKNFVDGQFVGTFDRATAAAVDLSAAGFGSTDSAAKTLGKALNDPIKGISALSRAGVTFSDAQKEQIQGFVDSGNAAKAQNLILKEVESQVGGVAAATATSGEKASVAFGNLKEQIGTALLPIIDRLAETFTNKIAPAVSTFVGQLQTGEGVGGRVAAAFTSIGGAIGTFVGQMRSGEGPGGTFASILGTIASAIGTLFTFINENRTVAAVFIGTIVALTVATAAYNAVLAANPIGLVVIAIAALAAGLVYAYKNSETFRNIVNKAFSVVKSVATSVAGFLSKYVPKAFQIISTLVGKYVAIYKTVVTTAFNVVRSIVGAVANFVVNSAQKYGQFARAVVDKVQAVVKFFRELPGKIKGFLTSLPGELKSIGGNIIQGLVNGIQGAAHKVLDAVQSIINKIPKKIRSLMGIASPSKVTTLIGNQIGDGLALGLKQSEDKVTGAADKLGKKLKEKLSKVRDSLSSLKSDFASLVEPIASNFTQGLFDFDTADAFKANLTTVKGTLTGLLSNFKTLIADGLSPGFLYQLFQQGGPGLINSLAGLPKAEAQEIGGLFGQVTSLSDELGTAVAGNTQQGAAMLSAINKTNDKLDRLIAQGDKAPDRIAEATAQPAKRARRRAWVAA